MINKINDIDLCDLHDAVLGDILFKYQDKVAIIRLELDPPGGHKYKEIELIFKDVSNFHVGINEPWGSGFYISETTITTIENNINKMEIFLNSGDKVIITYNLLDAKILK